MSTVDLVYLENFQMSTIDVSPSFGLMDSFIINVLWRRYCVTSASSTFMSTLDPVYLVIRFTLRVVVSSIGHDHIVFLDTLASLSGFDGSIVILLCIFHCFLHHAQHYLCTHIGSAHHCHVYHICWWTCILFPFLRNSICLPSICLHHHVWWTLSLSMSRDVVIVLLQHLPYSCPHLISCILLSDIPYEWWFLAHCTWPHCFSWPMGLFIRIWWFNCSSLYFSLLSSLRTALFVHTHCVGTSLSWLPHILVDLYTLHVYTQWHCVSILCHIYIYIYIYGACQWYVTHTCGWL